MRRTNSHKLLSVALVVLVATTSRSRTSTVTDAWMMIPPHHSRTSLSSSSSSTTSTSTSTSTSESTSEYTLDGQDIRGPIIPVSNIVFVRVKETLSATSGGIFLPDQSKEKPSEGLVIAAGPGRLHPHGGVRMENPIKPEMSVVYGKFDGRAVTYNGEECQVITDDNVLLAYTGATIKLDNVMPMLDYVLIDLLQGDHESGNSGSGNGDVLQTKSGVVVAAQILADKAICEGRVVKVGPGRRVTTTSSGTTEFTKSPVRVGDYVKFKDYAGNQVRIQGKEYAVVKMVDILATRMINQ